MVHRGPTRHFSELSYWYCHEALNFRICLVQTPYSTLFSYKVKNICHVYFLMYLYLNFTFANFGLHLHAAYTMAHIVVCVKVKTKHDSMAPQHMVTWSLYCGSCSTCDLLYHLLLYKISPFVCRKYLKTTCAFMFGHFVLKVRIQFHEFCNDGKSSCEMNDSVWV